MRTKASKGRTKGEGGASKASKGRMKGGSKASKGEAEGFEGFER